MPVPPARFSVVAVCLGGALLSAGCANSAFKVDALAVEPEEAAEMPQVTGLSAEEGPDDVLAVVVPPSERRVRWLDDGNTVLAVTPSVLRRRSIVGTDIGVVGLDNETLLVFDRDEGLLGQARIDAPSWFGVLGDDRILVSVGRDLFRGDVERALSGEWEYLGAFYDTVAWDISADHFVRATPWSLYLSRDGGDSFTEVFKAPPGEELFNTEVRADGVIAVISADSNLASRLYLSTDGGASFEMARFQPPGIGRTGARLHYQNLGCTWALTANGVDWVRDDDWDDPGNWNQLGTIGNQPRWRATGNLARNDEPAAPAPGEGEVVTGAPPPCDVPDAAWGDAGADSEVEAAPCTLDGLGCLAGTAGPPVVAGRHDYGFLGDGVCNPVEACTSPTRLPTLVTWDRDTGYLDPIDLPAACEVPTGISVGRGLGVLTCTDAGASRHDVYVRSQSVGWTLELSMAGSAVPVVAAQSADGTLALSRACEVRRGFCDVHVRPPVEVGAAEPWRAIEGDDVVGLRALDGGQLLTVHSAQLASSPVALSEATGSFPTSLVLTVADGSFWGDRFVLLDEVELDAPISDIQVSAGTGRLMFYSQSTSQVASRYEVRRDGSLLQVFQ